MRNSKAFHARAALIEGAVSLEALAAIDDVDNPAPVWPAYGGA